MSGKIGGALQALCPDWESHNRQVTAKIGSRLASTDPCLGPLVIQQLQLWKRGEAAMEAQDCQYQELAVYLSDPFMDAAWGLVILSLLIWSKVPD